MGDTGAELVTNGVDAGGTDIGVIGVGVGGGRVVGGVVSGGGGDGASVVAETLPDCSERLPTAS